MAKMNMIMMLLALIIFNTTESKAQNNTAHSNFFLPAETKKIERSQGMIKIHTDFFSLIKHLEKNLPLTRQKIIDAGFRFITKDGVEVGADDMPLSELRGIQVDLSDGVKLDRISLREYRNGPLFIIDIKGKEIMRGEVERELGKFKLAGIPRGGSPKEEFVYIKKVGKSDIRAGYSQHKRDLLLGISFNSEKETE